MKTLTTIKLMVPFLMAIVLPPPTLLLWLGITMVLDFITGVAKAIKNDEPRTSTGFRRTVMKFIQHPIVIFLGGALTFYVITGLVTGNWNPFAKK